MKHKNKIKNRVVLLVILSTLSVAILSIMMVYFFSLRLTSDLFRHKNTLILNMLSAHFTEILDKTVKQAVTYANSPLWQEQIKKVNLRYKNVDNVNLNGYFQEMDRKWLQAKDDDIFLQEYLNNSLSKRFEKIIEINPEISEIFVTDKFGGIVAALGKTSDFYQADEYWWQSAYADNKGKIFLGDIEFDDSVNDWIIRIAVPAMDDNGSIIGICNFGISKEHFFGSINKIKFKEDVCFIVINDKGDIVYSRGKCELPVGSHLYRKENFDLETNPLFYKQSKKDGVFLYADIESPYLTDSNIKWKAVLIQENKDLLVLVKKITLVLAVILLTLLIITVPIGNILGRRFARPIIELSGFAKTIISGGEVAKLELKTNDELQDFADMFENAILVSRAREKELIATKEELEKMSSNLENKVSERTRELERAQEATLNILEDLTETKEALEKYSLDLENALKVKTDFTSMVSHELRTPLAAIKESISIVYDGTAGTINAEQLKFLGMAKRNVDRLVRLINEILDFQRLESGAIVLKLAENNINEIVKEAFGTMSSMALARGLNLSIELDGSIPATLFDRDKIIQVLVNLIGNAIKFTETGSIIVTTNKQENTVKVCVKDTGPGIKEEDKIRLFHKFEQLEKDLTRKTGGTGLGLAISKEIIQLHKGKIWVDSEYGKGSNFCFILPIRERRELGSA